MYDHHTMMSLHSTTEFFDFIEWLNYTTLIVVHNLIDTQFDTNISSNNYFSICVFSIRRRMKSVRG